MSIGPPILRYNYFKIWPSRSRLILKIQRSRLWSRSNLLVTFEAWSSVNIFDFVLWQSEHFWLRYRKFHIWPWKIQGQGHGLGQNRGSHLNPRDQSICLLFVSWQSNYFWLRYRKFHIWPWKFKVKVMAKVQPNDHIWALKFHRYVCFSFRGNRTIFGWDITNSIFDLEKSKSGSWPRSNPMVTFEP